MEALIAYIKFVGKGTPEGVRIAGMGLRPIATPTQPPDARRGEAVYAKLCVDLSQGGRPGRAAAGPGVGYTIPPLWGDASFNAGAGMAKTAYAASYIRDNMPFGINYLDAGAHRAAGLGRGGLYDLQAASAGDAGNRVRAAIRQRPRARRETRGRLSNARRG